MRSPEGPGAGVAAGARHAVASTRASGGEPLPPRVRDFFADRMGASFDGVRVHDGPAAARAARSVAARAFTVGRDVVFGAGQYRPDTAPGRELIAHELVHTLQADDGVVRRQTEMQPAPERIPAPPARRPASASGPAAGTAAATPAPEVTPSRNGEPCACVVFMHNNERNARLTAQLLHAHCRYNLAMVSPDNGARELGQRFQVERGRAAVADPNELFPADISRECINDPVGCRAFLLANEGARDAPTIRRFVLIRFFMQIYDCSRGFTLPVIALHNNAPEETGRYRARRNAAGTAVPDLVMDIDPTPTPKVARSAPLRTVAQLRALLRRTPWGAGVEGQVMDTPRTTNIFRWCGAPDIGACHIGDPNRPDHVIWTTNRADFNSLLLTPVNVVLQVRAGRESLTDLSTLFLNLHGLIDARVLTAIENDSDVALADLRRAYAELSDAPSVTTGLGVVGRFLQLLAQLIRLAEARQTHALTPNKIRYVNIETPGFALRAVTHDERVESFRMIMTTLRALKLDCCDAAGAPDGAIEQGLRAQPAAPPPPPPPPRRPRRP